MADKIIKQRIFVCDDDVKARSSIETMLGYTYTVSGASSGEELLEALAKDNNFVLILLDNNMPGMKGIEALPEIRKKHPHIKVVMYSGDTDMKNDFLRAGSSAFISKPAAIQTILDTIEKVLTGEVIKDEKEKTSLAIQYDEINNGLHAIGFIVGNAMDEMTMPNSKVSAEEHLKNYKKIISHSLKVSEAVTIIEAFLHVNKIDFRGDINQTELLEFIKKHSL